MYCARSGMKTAVLEKLSAGGQMSATDRIDNYPGFGEGIDGFELGERMRSGAEKSGAETIYEEAAALSVGGDGKKKILTRSGEIAASAVIAAVGARARELGLPGERSLVGRGIAYCAACDGARYKGKRVVVVGGGNTAVGDALYLSGICEKVTLVHRRDSLRAPAARLKELETHGVEVVLEFPSLRAFVRRQADGRAPQRRPHGRGAGNLLRRAVRRDRQDARNGIVQGDSDVGRRRIHRRRRDDAHERPRRVCGGGRAHQAGAADRHGGCGRRRRRAFRRTISPQPVSRTFLPVART